METAEGAARPQNYTSHESGSNRDHASTEENQTHLLQAKPRNTRSIAIVYGFQCLESTCFCGVSANLAVYLKSVLNESNTATAAKASVWNGTCYFMPLIGAFIADSYLGNYKTILLSGMLYIPGMTMITISAILSSVHHVSEVNKALFFSGLYLAAAGGGGIKAALVPHAMEQFDEDESSTERRRKEEFFNRLYVCLDFGVLASGIFIVWIQVNVSWALGFGLSTACVVLALLLFIAGTPTYRMRKPSESPLKILLQVLVASMKKTNTEPPADEKLLNDATDNEILSRKQKLAQHTK